MIRKATQADLKVISDLAAQLHHAPADTLFREFEALLKNNKALLLVLEIKEQIQGFSQVQLRSDYVEGCQTSPVGYLEAIYVTPEYCRQGHGTALLEEAKAWTKAQGCSEFASDTELTNENGYRFHIKSGFQETNRLITFKQDL